MKLTHDKTHVMEV